MSAQRKWFITGASGGLGLALTRQVLSQGHHVVVAVRRPDSMAALGQEFPGLLTVEALDVTNLAQINAVAQRHPDVDVVVNNAGGAVIGAMEELSQQEIDQQITLNLLAPIHVTRAFLPALRARKSGTFVHITSMGGRVGFASGALYHAAKYGLEGFAEAVNQEIAEFGIKTLIIEPGSIQSNFVANIHWTQEMDAYRDSTVDKLRQWIRENGDTNISGDPLKMAAAIYQLTQLPEPPLRTVLGADAYDVLHAAYTQSLKALEAQKAMARSVAIEGKSGFKPA